MNFHSWAASNGATWDKTDDSQLGQTLLELLRRDGCDGRRPAPDAKRFDTVLIDEAQDFESDWFQCALAAMKDPHGDLLIVGDRGQGMYRRSKVSWKQLGVDAVGRTQYLRQNYRNTRPMLRLASLFSNKDHPEDEDGLGHVWADPECGARISGLDPALVKRANKKDEIERTVGIVFDLLHGLWFGEKIVPIKPEEIGILYPRIRNDDRALIKGLCDRLTNEEERCPAVWLSESSASRRKIGSAGVKILTAHAAKGLQFKAVILLFANECPARFADTTEEDERRLFYVALTRAEDFLAVSYSGPSKFIDEIKAAMKPAH
jgi:superfamily I DNA/RNA helicase